MARIVNLTGKYDPQRNVEKERRGFTVDSEGRAVRTPEWEFARKAHLGEKRERFLSRVKHIDQQLKGESWLRSFITQLKQRLLGAFKT
jgi:hypothetical protein